MDSISRGPWLLIQQDPKQVNAGVGGDKVCHNGYGSTRVFDRSTGGTFLIRTESISTQFFCPPSACALWGWMTNALLFVHAMQSSCLN